MPSAPILPAQTEIQKYYFFIILKNKIFPLKYVNYVIENPCNIFTLVSYFQYILIRITPVPPELEYFIKHVVV